MGTNWFFDMLGIVLATIFAVEYGKLAVRRYKRENPKKDVDMKSHTMIGETKCNTRLL